MKRNKRLLIGLMTCILISTACAKKQELELWVVEQRMPLYEISNDDNLNEIGVLKIGDICTPGESVVEKMFQYTEVLCLKQGYGWVADNHFRIIKSGNE